MWYYIGRDELSGEEILRIGGFNALLKSSLPEELQYFKADKETFESTHKDFKTCFPRGFTWEVIEVYSPPPLIAFKFRHWGFFEGPYNAHSPTGELVQFYGMGTLEVKKSWHPTYTYQSNFSIQNKKCSIIVTFCPLTNFSYIFL